MRFQGTQWSLLWHAVFPMNLRMTSRPGPRNGKNGKVRRSLAFGRVRLVYKNSWKSMLRANRSERARTSLALAMQKVEGSSPFIRSESSCKSPGFVVHAVNGVCRVARFALAIGGRDVRNRRDSKRGVASVVEAVGHESAVNQGIGLQRFIHERRPTGVVNVPAALRRRHLQKVM